MASKELRLPPQIASNPAYSRPNRHLKRPRPWYFLILGLCVYLVLSFKSLYHGWTPTKTVHVPLHAAETLAKCQYLDIKPAPPVDFYKRKVSDRYQPGAKPVLLRNATIWTGRVNGLEVLRGDVYMEGGIIKGVGEFRDELVADGVPVIDVQGAWVTPGIIDVHSHIGVISMPLLDGANDGNANKGPVAPWLRSLDAINTHDFGYEHSIAGGVTTSLILPGSANAIGGQGFVIKLRPTSERSPTSMLLEPPFGINGSHADISLPPRWRHIKHACGENPSRSYGQTRMDTSWNWREAYNKARQIKKSQDSYCAKALNHQWDELTGQAFPEDLQWESLVDVLRGRVKVQTHCYEAVDIANFVRISNEFQFPIAAFHHAHEAYLAPEVLKQAYEHPPAIAMFATFARYKREAYRHSEFAPRILNDDGIRVLMKSDHPGIQSRYLIHEAQQAHFYGLPENVALSSVTTTGAEVLGLEHRIGLLKEGYDADVVVWDSHPLSLAATPSQVYVDGTPQFEHPFTSHKPENLQLAPKTPNFDREAQAAKNYEGLPPLEAVRARGEGIFVFTNVANVYQRDETGRRVVNVFATSASNSSQLATVVVEDGEISCFGVDEGCVNQALIEGAVVVDTERGAITPGLVAVSQELGLAEIIMEPSTGDGVVFDPLSTKIPSILGGEESIIRAADGLSFGTRDALLAYRSGVTMGVTSPLSGGFFGGLGVAFSLGAKHKLEKGAIAQEVAGLHVRIFPGVASISTQIAALRRQLLTPDAGERGEHFVYVTEGYIPIIVHVDSADVIASLIDLKKEVEGLKYGEIKMTIVGGAEAHLLAKELSVANVGVILAPARSFPYSWDKRRTMQGPPISEQSAATYLMSHNVTVALAPQGTSGAELVAWAVRNLRFDAAWAALGSGGLVSMTNALDMVSTNVEELLGVRSSAGEWVVSRGGELLSFESKVVAIISAPRAVVDFFNPL